MLLRRFGVHTKGAIAIEFAMIFPIMITIYFGVVEMSNALAANRKVTMLTSTVDGDCPAREGRTRVAPRKNSSEYGVRRNTNAREKASVLIKRYLIHSSKPLYVVPFIQMLFLVCAISSGRLSKAAIASSSDNDGGLLHFP